MRAAIHARIATLILCVLATACASPPQVVKLYDSPQRAAANYERLFVVVISSDADLRVAMEERMLRELRGRGVTAVPSHTVFAHSEGILQEDLDRAAAAAGAGGILLSHVASVDTEVEEQAGREEIVSQCRGGDPLDYFLYDHRVLREPDSVRLAHTVVVITNLYDTADGERVWTIQSTCLRKADLYEVAVDEAQAIVRQLAIDHLI
ncbi:MAG TPA: hypothetical protein VFE85_00630 [Woeseiaceae bacterium]|nr:hypothetical protein [Woeseiaceae bacterium]